MEDFGKRLKQERERLGMNQKDFGEACGVGKTAQYNYERGERSPDIQYLRSVGKIGVDVPFLVTGIPTVADTLDRRALLKVLDSICQRLGVDYISVLDAAWDDVKEEAGGSLLVDKDLRTPLSQEVESAVTNAIVKIELDGNLLEAVLTGIEAWLEHKRLSIPPAKKALLAVMLYRSSKALGRVDLNMIDDALKLASA